MYRGLTFFSLYVAQSIPMSLISTLLPVLMRQGHFSLTSIGLLQLIKLPWILKLLWAPLVDRYSTSLRDYKLWIWGSEIVYALCIFGVALLNLELNFSLILSLVVCAFVASATQDIATDALTSRVFSEDTISANRLQSMGQFAGTLIGGGVLMLLYKYWGWTNLFVIVALLVLFLLIPLHLYRKELKDYDVTPTERVSWSDIIRFFRRSGARRRCIMLLLFNAGLVGSMAMMKPYLTDAGYSLAHIGLLFSLYGASCGFLSSWLSGRYLKTIQRHQALFFSACCIAISSALIAAIAYLQLTTWPFIMLSLLALWGAYGMGTVMIYAEAMDFVRPGREGTDFTLQIVLLHLSSIFIASLSGTISQRLGYVSFFFVEFIISMVSLIYIYTLKNERTNTAV